MKISSAIIFFVLLIAQGHAFSDGSSKAEAEILLSTMGMETALEQSISQMLNIQIQQKPSLEPFKPVMLEFFSKHMSYESLKPDMITIYAEAFTALELREINAFYKTTTGAKTIKLLPVLMAKGGQLGARRVQDNLQELQEMIKEKAEQIKAEENN